MRIALFLALALIATGAFAATPPARLGLCAACHGADGRARIPGAPNLAGQNYPYLMNALHAYQSGARDVAVMRAAIGPLSDAELQRLARWYSLLPCAPAQAAR
jgi:cytochrome c553